ncbi:hypothetical protein [Halovulum sp. GXIMD14793]
MIAGVFAFPARADLTCDDVRTDLRANRIQPLDAAESPCDPTRELGAKIVLAGAGICYMTGLPELPPRTGKRTITMRKGGETVTIEVDPYTPDIDEDPTIDTVELVVAAKMCQSRDAVRLAEGTWMITGRDGGEAFSAKGYFPADAIWIDSMTFGRDGSRKIGVGFELPLVQLELDKAERSISGVAVFPIFTETMEAEGQE